MTTEIIVHGPSGGLDLVEVDVDITVADLAARCGDASSAVWRQDANEPLSPDMTLAEAAVSQHDHLHVSGCPAVTVTVHFNGDSRQKAHPPCMTVGNLLIWATGIEGHGLPESERPRHLLARRNPAEDLSASEHLGSLTNDCVVELDLVAKERYAG